MNEGYFVNWLGSVLSLFNMTLNRILGFVPSRLYVGTLVFLTMFSLLAHIMYTYHALILNYMFINMLQ